VQVDAASDRNLFYFFAEAQNGNADAPVVLWQTGGPGCSSLIAMLSEMGPYRVNASDTSKLTLDAYSWNQQAHMLWVESPAGVGFSYSKNPSDYINVNDTRTANDMYNFLQTFVNDLFPQYQKNNWFITAESYGGHYAPTMSRRIIEGNDRM
jgi:serine carboxypeptidase-like clade 2